MSEKVKVIKIYDINRESLISFAIWLIDNYNTENMDGTRGVAERIVEDYFAQKKTEKKWED